VPWRFTSGDLELVLLMENGTPQVVEAVLDWGEGDITTVQRTPGSALLSDPTPDVLTPETSLTTIDLRAIASREPAEPRSSRA
jgi:hypothetical protein